jgi:hypothetical protein
MLKQTIESMKAQTTEEGDCLLWNGVMCNKVPYVRHEGTYQSARKVFLIVAGKKIRQGAKYFATSCGNPDCVNPEHIISRTQKEHMAHCAKQLPFSPSEHIRRAKIAKNKRATIGKLTEAQADEIRLSDESGPVLGATYGVSRSLVNKIKRCVAWRIQSQNPFRGLM